jgi:hypothetical protein
MVFMSSPFVHDGVLFTVLKLHMIDAGLASCAASQSNDTRVEMVTGRERVCV